MPAVQAALVDGSVIVLNIVDRPDLIMETYAHAVSEGVKAARIAAS